MTVLQVVISNDGIWEAEMLRNRKRELGYLDTRYDRGRAELVVLYGRLCYDGD